MNDSDVVIVRLPRSAARVCLQLVTHDFENSENESGLGVREEAILALRNALAADHGSTWQNKPEATSQEEPVPLRFPTLLRRMWSGSEVQQWLDERGPLFAHPPKLSEPEETLNKIYALLTIGEQARTPSTLLHCLSNVMRFSEYLCAIEREFLMVPGEPSDEPEDAGCEPDDECLVNRWGAPSISAYVEDFRAALQVLSTDPKRTADLAKFVGIVKGCYRLASSHAGSIDGVDEGGGENHGDPVCAIFHRLHYAQFLVPNTK